MGHNVLEIFENSSDWHKLSIEEYTEMCQGKQNTLIFLKETYSLSVDTQPKIIIAGSGMGYRR